VKIHRKINEGTVESPFAKASKTTYIAGMSRVELAIEKVKSLDENQAEALLEWIELRRNREALRQRLDAEIEIGLKQLKAGEKIPSEQVYAEIRERSQRRRSGSNA
jgi:hypothetical protein